MTYDVAVCRRQKRCWRHYAKQSRSTVGVVMQCHHLFACYLYPSAWSSVLRSMSIDKCSMSSAMYRQTIDSFAVLTNIHVTWSRLACYYDAAVPLWGRYRRILHEEKHYANTVAWKYAFRDFHSRYWYLDITCRLLFPFGHSHSHQPTCWFPFQTGRQSLRL